MYRENGTNSSENHVEPLNINRTILLESKKSVCVCVFFLNEEIWLIDLMHLFKKRHIDEKVGSCVSIWPWRHTGL